MTTTTCGHLCHLCFITPVKRHSSTILSSETSVTTHTSAKTEATSDLVLEAKTMVLRIIALPGASRPAVLRSGSRRESERDREREREKSRPGACAPLSARRRCMCRRWIALHARAAAAGGGRIGSLGSEAEGRRPRRRLGGRQDEQGEAQHLRRRGQPGRSLLPQTHVLERERRVQYSKTPPAEWLLF
jgi:hypothetical protein